MGRILGMVILCMGIVVLIIGINASQSAIDQLSEAFTGKFTDETTWYLVGGIGAIVGGLLLTLFGGRRSA